MPLSVMSGVIRAKTVPRPVTVGHVLEDSQHTGMP